MRIVHNTEKNLLIKRGHVNIEKRSFSLLQDKYLILLKPAENDKKTAYASIFHAVRMQLKKG